MGSSNAIAEAGISLVNMLKKNMTPEPIASPESIGLCLPTEPEDFQLTVWMYNFEEQNTMSGSGFRPDPADPSRERFSPMQLKLYMLITAHSKAPPQIRAADEYRIIGRVMQLMRDMPVIEPEYLEGSLAGDSSRGLMMEPLKLAPEEIAKIMNNPSGNPKMSFALTLSVSIESNLTRSVEPRVGDAHIRLTQLNQTRKQG